MAGRHGECTPGYLEDMHRHIAGSQLTIIGDAPHLCFAEQPGRLHRNYQFFTQRVLGRGEHAGAGDAGDQHMSMSQAYR